MPTGSTRIAAVGVGLLLALAGGCSMIEVPGGPPQPVEPPGRAAPTKPAAKPKDLTPPQLVGLNEDEVVRLLGPAGSRREEPPATVWQYRAPDCALDLFFYMDMETKRFRALAYDLSTTDGSKGDRALNGCLKQITERRR